MRAIVSVSDKTGVADFARELAELGFAVFSTGGTMKALKEAGVPVKEFPISPDSPKYWTAA